MPMIQRRKFIKHGSAASLTALTWTPSFAAASANRSPNDTIQVAIMGVRSRGRDLAGTFATQSNVNVAALCDIDERLLPKVAGEIERASGNKPRTETDIRRVLDDKAIDAVVIASPNHWHALATIWACQAGKDVYVEKPVSHNLWEGRQMVEAAQKYQRIVQVGTQRRSRPVIRSAMDYLHAGKLGKVYMIRCVCFRARESIGRKSDGAVPEGVHYDLFLGPARWQTFNENRFHYNWHWFWDTGNGETGNNGVHLTDLARWALQKNEHPVKVQSMGGRDVFDQDQETPNSQLSQMQYADGTRVQLEVRGLYTNSEQGTQMGLLIYTSEGWMQLAFDRWSAYFGRKNKPGESQSEAGTGIDGQSSVRRVNEDVPHVLNFIDCVRSRKREALVADILEGHLSASMCHLSNIAYRTGRQVDFDSASETISGDTVASSYLKREYRPPYVVPAEV